MRALGLSVLGAGLGVLVVVLAFRRGAGDGAETLRPGAAASHEDVALAAPLAAPRVARESQEAWVEVRVHPPDGVGLADLGVIEVGIYDGTPGLREARATTEVDEEGEARLGPFPPGMYLLLVDPERGGRGKASFDCAAGETTLVEVDLPVGARVQGAVVDEDGRPIPEALLAVTGAGLGGQRRTLTTDVLGRFEIEGLERGSMTILAAADGFVEEVLALDLEPEEVRPGVRIVLGRGKEVAGRVVWPDGEPVGGVTVVAQIESGMSSLRAAQVVFHRSMSSWKDDTSSDGSFRIGGLPRGPYTLEVDPPIALTTRHELAASGEKGDYRERRAAWLASAKRGRWRGRVTGVEPGEDPIVIELRQSDEE